MILEPSGIEIRARGRRAREEGRQAEGVDSRDPQVLEAIPREQEVGALAHECSSSASCPVR